MCFLDHLHSYFSCNKLQQAYSGVSTFVRKDLTCTQCQEGLTGLVNPDHVIVSLIDELGKWELNYAYFMDCFLSSFVLFFFC